MSRWRNKLDTVVTIIGIVGLLFIIVLFSEILYIIFTGNS